jgi:chromosome segregation ATPase
MKKRTVGLISVALMLGWTGVASSQSLFQRCEKQKEDLNAMKIQVGDIESKMAPMESEIADLRNRLREAEDQKAAKAREKLTLLSDIKRMENEMDHRCGALKQCDSLENRVEALSRRAAPLGEDMRQLREEIRERSTESSRLDGEVDRIENSYRQLNCDNLIPGQTAQTTIERCSELFGRWNHLQADINRLQDSINDLRKRHQRIMAAYQAIGREISELLAQMRPSCSHSARVAELEGMEEHHRSFATVKDDLDDMDKHMKRFKGVRVVQPKLMEVKPAIKQKEDDDKPPKMKVLRQH